MNFRTILAASLATAAGLSAVGNTNWTGADTDTDWNNTANWTGTVGDKSFFLKDKIVGSTITFASDYTLNNYMSFQNGLENPIVFSGPKGLTCSSGIYLGGGNDGSLLVTDGTYSLTGEWRVGQDESSPCSRTGVYRQTGGTMTMDTFSGGYTTGGTGKLYLEGGVLNATSDFKLGSAVGAYGEALISGGTLTANALNVAPKGEGLLVVSNEADIVVTTNFRIGNAGTATGRVDVVGGHLTARGTSYIADSSSVGVMNVSGGEVCFANDFRVGQGGGADGRLTVSGGSLTVSNNLYVARGKPSTGSIKVSGEGALYVVKDLQITCPDTGYFATGVVEVAGGLLSVTSGAIKVAQTANVQGRFDISGGTVAVTNGNGNLIIVGSGVGTVGTWNMSDGEVYLSGSTAIGSGEGSCGVFNMNGGYVRSNWRTNFGEGNSSTGLLYQTGGTIEGYRGISFGKGANSVSKAFISGGEFLASSRESFFGQGAGSTTYVEVSENGTFTCKADLDLFNTNENTKVAFVAKTGGVMAFKRVDYSHVESTAVHGSAAIVMDGGTIRPTESKTDWIPASTGFALTNTTNGGTIDTASYNVTVGTAIGGTGNLIKKGSGTLTLAATPSYTGYTEVQEGTLVVAEGVTLPGGVRDSKGTISFTGNTFPGKLTVPSGEEFVYDPSISYPGITLEEGATMVIKVSNYTSGMTVTLPTVTVPTGSKLEDMVIINVGHRATITVDTSSGTPVATITDVDDPTAALTTRWTNASGDGQWRTAGNWTFGVPTAIDTAVIESDATIYEEGNKTVTNVVADLKILNDSTLTYRPTDPYNNQVLLAPKVIEGAGTLKLYRAILMTVDSPLTVPDTIDIEIQAERVNRRGEIAAESDANAITINGRVIVPDAGEGNNQFRLYRCVINGELIINSYNSFANRFSKDSGSRLESCKIYGKVSGTGDVAYVTCRFDGDWSGFYGAAGQRADATKSNTFVGPFDGSHAYWGLGTNTKLDTTSGNVFKFGTVTNVMTGAVITPHKDKETIMEVGERDEDCYLVDNYACHEGGATAGALPKFTLRKVGTGTLHTDTYGIANWAVTNGVLAFAAIAEGTTLSEIPDKTISNITVSGTGKVTGELNNSAVTTIGSLVYDGVKFGLTATNNNGLETTVANPVWTNALITATTLQNHCAFVCDEDTIDVLKDVRPVGTTHKVMDGTNLSGAIDELVVSYRTEGDQQKKDLVWQSIVNASKVMLKLVKKGQFFLIIR